MFFVLAAFLSPMVVNDLHLLRTAVLPNEYDAPLVVDSNAVVPFQVSRQRLESIAWW